MSQRKKWQIARRLKKRIISVKIIDPHSRETLVKCSFIMPREWKEMLEVLDAYR